MTIVMSLRFPKLFSQQMSMNAQKIVTTAMLMATVQIPKVLSIVPVILDILVMVQIAQVRT